MSRTPSGNSFKSRALVLLGSTLFGIAFIITGAYLWAPLIIVGIVILILGAFLSDTLTF